MPIREDVEKYYVLSVFFIFDMPRSPQNLRERAIGMLNAGLTINAVAMNIGCSTRASRHRRQRFQAQSLARWWAKCTSYILVWPLCFGATSWRITC